MTLQMQQYFSNIHFISLKKDDLTIEVHKILYPFKLTTFTKEKYKLKKSKYLRCSTQWDIHDWSSSVTSKITINARF